MGRFGQLDVVRRQAVDAGEIDDPPIADAREGAPSEHDQLLALLFEILNEEILEGAPVVANMPEIANAREIANAPEIAGDRYGRSDPRQITATICPQCGQPIVPAGLILPPIKARILEAVHHRPGIGAEELRGIVWADDPNGGPEDRKVLHVHICQLNKLIAPLGIAVRARKGGSTGYRIQDANQ